MDYDTIVAFMLGLGLFMVVFLAVWLALWILVSYNQYKVLSAMGSSVAWMSFFPILNHVALAREAADYRGDVELFGKKVSVDLFQLWILGYFLLCLVPVFGGIVAFAFYGLCRAEVLKQLYSKCEGKTVQEVTAISYISGFFIIVMWIKFMIYKKAEIASNINRVPIFGSVTGYKSYGCTGDLESDTHCYGVELDEMLINGSLALTFEEKIAMERKVAEGSLSLSPEAEQALKNYKVVKSSTKGL